MQIHTLTIRHGRSDPETVRSLLGQDQVLVVDYDAIHHHVINTAEYTYLSHMFDIIVLNLSGKLNDIIDTIMAGAAMVVIDPSVQEKRLREFFDITENIAMPYRGDGHSEAFSQLGGQYFVTDREIGYPFKLAYSTTDISGDRYIRVLDFPQDISDMIFERA
ncbi:hypothetical protein [Thermoplasma acidophilum]|uniref:Uncharacterized protein n=1 Tax=Thermoplasma acidophilum (strain ATCC 25905 / DSM 1728 / JCM 9062 / NBRC 15155 / AMRC-C165) TaxID=273075 RepID=Q9HIN0_THEAC|nr:hypothetical protein [Thermoplasma acidophilum]CAC12427.1 hypothetical protein [Thermoplasma acidophilum]